MKLKEQKIEIATKDGIMDAFIASPEGAFTASSVSGPTGQRAQPAKIRAIIVVQEAFGVNHHMEEVCRRVAREGYLAVAPEFFHREGRGLQFGYDDFPKVMPIFQKLSNAHIATDLRATLATLQEKYGMSSEQVAVMGFCMGGLASMIGACELPIATAISYYGGGMVESRPGLALSPIIGDFKKIRCPVLLFYGDQDQSIPPSQIQAVEAELKALGKTFEVIVYPGAGHGFSNDERSSYHEESTRAAWTETLAWLKRV